MNTTDIALQVSQYNPKLGEVMLSSPIIIILVIIEVLMKLIFYPIALYIAAKNQKKAWFIVLFVCFFILNDFALLPILFLFFNKRFDKIKPAPKNKNKKKK
jgi:hypothetical protein